MRIKIRDTCPGRDVNERPPVSDGQEVIDTSGPANFVVKRSPDHANQPTAGLLFLPRRLQRGRAGDRIAHRGGFCRGRAAIS